MQLNEIMSAQVETVGPDASIMEAAQLMRDLDVGPIPVCERDQILGIVTDRDLAIRAVAEGKDPNTTKVREVMTANIVWCYEDQDVEEAARVMEDKQVRRLIVLDRDKNLAGIVSLGDLAIGTGDDRLAGEVVERVSEPIEPPLAA